MKLISSLFQKKTTALLRRLTKEDPLHRFDQRDAVGWSHKRKEILKRKVNKLKLNYSTGLVT